MADCRSAAVNTYDLTTFQVAPTELEALLLAHADVSDALVVGVPDIDAGELPMAFVVRRDGSMITEDQLQAFVAGRQCYVYHP